MKPVLVALLFALPLLASEDPKLRQEANELAQRSTPASMPSTWPPHREITQFLYTDTDGAATEGLATLDYQAPFTRRIEISFGSYHALKIEGPQNAGEKRNEPLPPPGVRAMQALTPIYLILFDKEDIINGIRDVTIQGRRARCVQFTTNFGAQSKDGEACYDQSAGMLLRFQVGGEVIENSEWVQFAGVWLPSHIEKTEDGRRVISINRTQTPVDSFPADTFTLPPDVPPYQWCSDWRRPTGFHMPQPKAGSGENIDDIVVQGRIERDGTASHLAIRSSKRPDLNAEALAIAAQWTFRPATCEGKPQPSHGDFTLHFKGR